MKTWIVLFRGINVGGNNIIAMKELRRVLEEGGLHNVKTYIQSGNVVLQADLTGTGELSPIIQRSVRARFDLTPQVFALSIEEFSSIIESCPFSVNESAGSTLHIFFLHDPVSRIDTSEIESLSTSSESWHLGDRAFYLHAPDGIGRSKLASKVEKILKVDVTARNWRTVSKLVALAYPDQ